MLKILKIIFGGSVLTILLGIYTPSITFASCAEFNIEEAMNNDDAIFTGKVIKIQAKVMKDFSFIVFGFAKKEMVNKAFATLTG